MKFNTIKSVIGAVLLTLPVLSMADEPRQKDDALAHASTRVEVIALTHDQAEKLRIEREKHREEVTRINSEHTRTIESILGMTRDL